MLQPTSDLITSLPAGGYLIVPVKLMDQLHRFRQLGIDDSEAGGVLIGCLRCHESSGIAAGPTHIELIDCTVPNWWDKRSRFSFVRRSRHHLKKVWQAWERSRQEQSYLGEWHTHPEPHPTPSWEDIAQWENNLVGQQAILIIVGQKSDWVAYWDGHRPIPLPLLVPDLVDL